MLANKKPLAGSAAAYRRLVDTAASSGRRLRYEATVGAGLPVIDTFRKLVESGDSVRRVEGCVSGTLGFVLSSLDSGTSFSEALREAMARGYTEPDPREDLSGADALRKGLILARLLGFAGATPHADSLVVRALRRRVAPAVPGAPAGIRRRLERSRGPRGGARPRAALRRDRDAARRLGRAAGGSARLAFRLAAGHAQPAVVHHAALPLRAPGRRRPARGRRSRPRAS